LKAVTSISLLEANSLQLNKAHRLLEAQLRVCAPFKLRVPHNNHHNKGDSWTCPN
jgi:hypothetical protein